MFRNYLVAALRNLARNRLYAGINIVGLSVGFTAAILMALFVRSEFNFDTFLPGYDRVYSVAEIYHLPGEAPLPIDVTLPNIAAASMPSARSQDLSRFSPICPATLIEWRSPTHGSSPWTIAASRSAGRTTANTGALATKPSVCRHCGAPMLVIETFARAQHIRGLPGSSISP